MTIGFSHMAVIVDLDKSSWGTGKVSLIGMDRKEDLQKKKSKTEFTGCCFRNFSERGRREIWVVLGGEIRVKRRFSCLFVFFNFRQDGRNNGIFLCSLECSPREGELEMEKRWEIY